MREIVRQSWRLESECLLVYLFRYISWKSAIWRSRLDWIWRFLRDIEITPRTCRNQGRGVRYSRGRLRRFIRAILSFDLNLLVYVDPNQLSLDHVFLVTLDINSSYTRSLCIIVLALLQFLALALNSYLTVLLFVFDVAQLPRLVAEPKVLKPRYLDRVLFPLPVDIKRLLMNRFTQFRRQVVSQHVVAEKSGIIVINLVWVYELVLLGDILNTVLGSVHEHHRLHDRLRLSLRVFSVGYTQICVLSDSISLVELLHFYSVLLSNIFIYLF